MAETLKEIGSTVAKLRALLSETRKDLSRIQSLQSVLTSSLNNLWDSADILIQDQRLWKETLSLVASGRVLSVAAQAEHALDAVEREKSWVSSGSDYCRWIGRAVIGMCQGDCDTAGGRKLEAAAQLFGKSLMLGHNDVLVQLLLVQVIQGQLSKQQLLSLIVLFTRYEQRQVLSSVLRILSTKYLPLTTTNESYATVNNTVAASSALLESLMADASHIADNLCEHLISTPCNIYLARAALAALSLEHIEKLLHKVWEQFGDKLHIRHDTVLQQESTARILLLCVGYVHRAEPMSIMMHARSSLHSNAISNRLGSSSTRVRLLAMFVGEAVSELVDKEKASRMNFELEGDEVAEAALWKKLVYIEDKPSSIKMLDSRDGNTKAQSNAVRPKKTITAKKEKSARPMIVEVVDDGEEDDDDDDDLIPYAKPDSDVEDSDEDATLVQRNKPKPPVYIRDLVSALLDTSNAGAHTLALETAPSLIRRKANFGTELLDQLPNLASALTNLQDHFENPEFHDLCQASMIATIIAQPKTMGPWFVRECFVGEYSIGQRGAMLVAVGLAARELGGFGRMDSAAVTGQTNENFPTKLLQERLHRVYAGIDNGNGSSRPEMKGALVPSQTAEVDTLARAMEQSMLVPISTRKSAVAGKPRTKIIRNDLASVMAEAFFFPLTGYFHAHMQSRSTTSSYLTAPSLLTLYLKTLSILLQSAGPSVLILPQLTSELWSLLLSLRTQALKDAGVLEAVLFGFLTLLNVNEGQGARRRLAVECGRELVETREWVGVVWEAMEGRAGGSSGGDDMVGLKGLGMVTGEDRGPSGERDGDEQERCKVLAAAVLVQIQEVVEQYQRLMVGDLAMTE